MAALVLLPVPHKYIVNLDIVQCTRTNFLLLDLIYHGNNAPFENLVFFNKKFVIFSAMQSNVKTCDLSMIYSKYLPNNEENEL